MQRIDTAERRARIAVRHHLAPEHRVDTMVEAARGVVCLHATDPATVYLSTWARLVEPSFELIERELYEERRLIRMLAMRRTLFVVPTDEAPVLHAAASLDVARTERRRNEQLAELLGVDDPAGWMREAEAATIAALDERGEATAQELSRAVPALARKVRVNVGKRYEGDIGISSRVLILLALEGRIVRGRPRGTWISSQYRWASMERWLGAPLEVLDPETAQARLVARWLDRFGPGTEADIRWWTGLTARAVRAALATVGAEHGGPRRGGGLRPARRRRGDADPGALGRPAARPRPHDDGLAGPRLVPGRPQGAALRLERQRRARPSGRTAASWAAGPSATAGRSSPGCSRTSAARPSWPSRPRRPGSPPGSARCASCPASRPRTIGSLMR